MGGEAMKVRILVSMLAVMVIAIGCRRQQPPPPTPVEQPDTAGQGQRALDAARADSIRRAEEEARRRAAEGGARARDILVERVHFDYDQSQIRADAQEILRRKLEVLRANPGVELQVTGHADERGSIEYNLALGLRRANAVADYMRGFGVEAQRLVTETAGEDQPLEQGANEQAWSMNRRAEFRITRGGDNLVMPGN
jgi:peptidoglycan-associated lipoprotein